MILDEIGRGTSTYDGVALAWAVVEDLAKRAGGDLRTLFATHYHELTALEGRIAGVFTMNIAIREYNNDILFLHKLVPGPSDRSYGVEVARLAGVPGPVVQRARAILQGLERGRDSARKTVVSAVSLPGLSLPEPAKKEPELPEIAAAPPRSEHPLVLLLRELNPDELSPLDALRMLMEWNPMYHYVTMFRDFMMWNTVPGLGEIALGVAMAVITFVIGFAVFRKSENKFILYI